eukprot:CAMPEP_0114510350 /NCGR_PEP_ID=MMETSP0109-20121206/13734_1 /TAXON_ID=29199 /ORGANISM="Chlorarachnion reptans, Strain CCCM449" /LENGTH=1025 /DNA_ID=CAMNT_0001689639 /DNA_START=52 /DNA_END=3129 /DNA_ORIENTATION=-
MKFFGEVGESDSDSEREQPEVNNNTAAAKLEIDSSSDEEDKRVVRTEKDKRYDALKKVISKMKSNMGNEEWEVVVKDLNELKNEIKKAKKVIQKEGKVPDFVVRQFAYVQFVASERKKLAKEGKGTKLNRTNAKALNVLNQRIYKDIEKDYKKDIAALGDLKFVLGNKEAPKADDLDEDEDEGGEEQVGDEDGAEDGDGKDDSGDDWSDDYEVSDDEGPGDKLEDIGAKSITRAFWLKKDIGKMDEDEGPVEKKRRVRLIKDQMTEDQALEILDKIKDMRAFKNIAAMTKHFVLVQKEGPKLIIEYDEENDLWDSKGEFTDDKMISSLKKVDLYAYIDDPAPTAGAGSTKSVEKLTPLAVLTKLKEIEESRGKKGINLPQYIEDLEKLLKQATKPANTLKIASLIATALFDRCLNTNKAMTADAWKSCANHIDTIMDTLAEKRNLKLSEDNQDIDKFYIEVALEKELKRKEAEEAKQKIEDEEDDDDQEYYIRGSMHSFISRLATQFNESLRELNEHDESYVDRLKDMGTLIKIIKKCESYYSYLKKEHLLIKVKLLHLLQIYYIDNPNFDRFKDTVVSEKDGPRYLMNYVPLFNDDEKSDVYRLAVHLYMFEGSEKESARMKTIARLCHVYHYAIHNRFREARNLLLMSHIQDVIHNADINSRVLYNRTLAQLGLCAFRTGHYRRCVECLSEVCAFSNKMRELLAQGVTSTRYHERNHEKEKQERSREYPYHMHMNLDMLEAVNLVSAMFLEIPNIAKHSKRKAISRPFRKYYDLYKKLAYSGPPESTRNLVMGASEALAWGDWETCYKHICELRMWALMPHAEEIKQNLKHQVQKTALQIYLIVYGRQYCSVDVHQLCTMFEMEERDVHKIVSKMMLPDPSGHLSNHRYDNRGEILGAWDQPSGCIIMHNEDLSRLQQAADGFADKAQSYVEMHEKLLELRGRYYRGDYNKGGDSKGDQKGDRRGGHRGDRRNQGDRGYQGRRNYRDGDKGQSRGHRDRDSRDNRHGNRRDNRHESRNQSRAD